MPMVMRRMRVRRARSVARGIPRLSRQDTAVVRMEKAGVDTVPRLITTVINAGVNGLNGFTFAANFDAQMAFNPVNYLYTTSTAFIAQKALYKEWRLKQCKVHAMLQELTAGALAQWTAGQNLIVAYGWVRNAAYTAGVAVPYATMAIQPDTIQKVWNLSGAVPEFWTSCTAGTQAGEGNWLNCQFAPATAPNTGMYFMPELKVNTELVNNSADGVLNYVYEIECIVEFRGSLQ